MEEELGFWKRLLNSVLSSSLFLRIFGEFLLLLDWLDLVLNPLIRRLTRGRYGVAYDCWLTPASLYQNGNHREIVFLNYITRTYYSGDINTVQFILNTYIPKEMSPTTALAVAAVHRFAGNCADGAECIEQCLARFPSDAPQIPREVYRLMKIHWAYDQYECQGTLKVALEEARMLRAWLVDVKLEDYSDIMVKSVSIYHAIIKLVRIYSNWLEEGVDGDLPPTPEKNSPASLTALRRFLQEKQRFIECSALVKPEASLYEGDKKLMPYEEFLSVEWPLHGSEMVVRELCFNRIFFASALADLGRTSQAAEELKQVPLLLRRFTKDPLEKFNPRLYLLYLMVEVSAHPPSDPIELVQKRRKLVARASELGDRTIENLLLHQVHDTARELQDTNLEHHVGHFIAADLLRDATLEMLTFASEVGHIPNEVVACLGSVAIAGGLVSDAEWIQYLNRFETWFPNYNVPLLLNNLARHAVKAYRNLNDEDAVSRYLQVHQDSLASYPGMEVSADGSLTATTEQAEYQLYGRAVLRDEANQNSARIHYVMMILCMWLRRALGSGAITAERARVLLKSPDNETTNVKDWVNNDRSTILENRIFGDKTPVESAEWSQWFARIAEWLQQPNGPAPKDKWQEMLVHTWKSRVSSLDQHKSRTIDALDYEGKRRLLCRSRDQKKKFLDFAQSLEPRIFDYQQRHQLKGSIATDDFLILVHMPMGSRTAENYNDEAFAKIQVAREEYTAFLRETQSSRLFWLAASSVARVMFMRWRDFKSVSIFDALKYLTEADEVFYRVAGQGFIFQAVVNTMTISMTAAEDFNMAQLYEEGIDLSCRAWVRWVIENMEWIKANPTSTPPDYVQQVGRNLVMWIQKSKARALAAAMGVALRMPDEVWESIKVSSEAMDLITKYSELRGQIEEDPGISRNILAYQEMERLWSELEGDQSAAMILGMLRGRAIDLDGVRGMCKVFNEPVIFVDWFQHDQSDGRGDLLYALYRNGQLLNIFHTGLAYKQVEAWVSEYLDPAPGCDAVGAAEFVPLDHDRFSAKHLGKMDGLLDELHKFVQPGELMVFCPTKILNRVPLHALHLGGEVCIVRNPVVYTQSLTLLRLCIFNRLALLEGDEVGDRQPAVICPLGSQDDTVNEVADLANSMSTKLDKLDVWENPKQEFINRVANASIVHFHGHVEFDEAEAMEHHLVLTNYLRDEQNDIIPLKEKEKLPAKEVFGMRLRQGTHITTISCKSGRAKVSNVNDHVGLVAAFHCAGAPSMISSLRNLHRDIGLRFSKLFYEHLQQQNSTYFTDENGNLDDNLPLVDMARAMQHAVLNLRVDPVNGEVLKPSAWAGLILNGSWHLPQAWVRRDTPVARSSTWA